MESHHNFPFLHLCSSVQNWRAEVIEYIHSRCTWVADSISPSFVNSNCLSRITKNCGREKELKVFDCKIAKQSQSTGWPLAKYGLLVGVLNRGTSSWELSIQMERCFFCILVFFSSFVVSYE